MGGAEYNPYDSEDDDDDGPRELDRPLATRSVKLRRLRATAETCELLWAVLLISLLIDPILFRKTILRHPPPDDKDIPRIRPTDPALLPHLRLLKDWQIMMNPEKGVFAQVLASYFEVRKKNKKLRTIVDCRPVNAMCKTPPRVNLASIPDLLMRIAKLGRCYLSVGDFSGWFHQLEIPAECYDLFGIVCADTLFLMCCVPMGFSWACVLAQCVTWAIICVCMKDDRNGKLGMDAKKYGKELPPGIIDLERTQGLLCAYYDNIIVATKSRFLGGQWRKRIMGNAEAFGAKWNPDEILSEPAQEATALGLLINTANVPKWKHCPKKVATWNKWWHAKNALTPRYVAKIVGLAVWDSTIRLQPLFELHEVIDVLRSLHERYQLKYKRDWYQAITLSDKDVRVLCAKMDMILVNPWHEPVIHQTAVRQWVAASDASDFAWGYVVLRGQSGPYLINTDNLGKPGQAFPIDLQKTHIFIKELYAAVRLIKMIASISDGQPADLTLLMDNTAAMHCLQKGYSKNDAGRALVKRVFQLAKDANIRLTIKWIASDDNPADNPSRLMIIDEALCARALELADDVWRYEFTGAARRKKWNDVPDDKPHDAAAVENNAMFDDELLDVNDDIMDELDSCDPDEDDATMHEGLSRLFNVLVGEQCASVH